MHRDVLSGRARISLWPHDGTISVYRNQELLKTIRAAVEVGRVESLAFSTDGKHLAVGTAPGAAYVWNIETGEEAVRLQS